MDVLKRLSGRLSTYCSYQDPGDPSEGLELRARAIFDNVLNKLTRDEKILLSIIKHYSPLSVDVVRSLCSRAMNKSVGEIEQIVLSLSEKGLIRIDRNGFMDLTGKGDIIASMMPYTVHVPLIRDMISQLHSPPSLSIDVKIAPKTVARGMPNTLTSYYSKLRLRQEGYKGKSRRRFFIF